MQLKLKDVISSGLPPQEAPVICFVLKGVICQLQACLWYRVIELELGQWHEAATSCPLAAKTVTASLALQKKYGIMQLKVSSLDVV